MAQRILFCFFISTLCVVTACDATSCPKVGMLSDIECQVSEGVRPIEYRADELAIGYVECYQQCVGVPLCESSCVDQFGQPAKRKADALIACVENDNHGCMKGDGALDTRCISLRCASHVKSVYGEEGVFPEDGNIAGGLETLMCTRTCFSANPTEQCIVSCFEDASFKARELMYLLLECNTNVFDEFICSLEDENCLHNICPFELRAAEGSDEVYCSDIVRCFRCDQEYSGCFSDCTGTMVLSDEVMKWESLSSCIEQSAEGAACLLSSECLERECPFEYFACYENSNFAF